MQDNNEPLVITTKMAPWQHLLFFVIPTLAALALRWEVDGTEFKWTFTIYFGATELGVAVVLLFVYYLVRRVPWLIMGHRSQLRHWRWKQNQQK